MAVIVVTKINNENQTVIAGSSTNSALEIKDHCNKTVEIYEEVSSPELTNANRNRPLLCTYRFRSFRGAPRDWVLRIRFKKFKIGKILNATHCQGGYLQVSLILICSISRRFVCVMYDFVSSNKFFFIVHI